MNFKNKIVLITGASRGIGAETANTFEKLGALVIGSATSNQGVKIISNTLISKQSVGLKIDFSKEEDIKNAFNLMKKSNILPDIVVNNAGITRDNIIFRLSEDDWAEVINTNLTSVFKLSKMAVRYMIKKRWGRIINIGSVVSFSGSSGQTNYCASKAGIIGFSKALAQEIATRNITVNVVAPGFIQTNMTDRLSPKQKQNILQKIPLQKIGSPKNIAEVVAFLASDHAEYITGQTIHVNGGMYMA